MARGDVRILFSLIGEDKLSGAIEKSQKQLDKFGKEAEDATQTGSEGFRGFIAQVKGLPGELADVNAGVELFQKALSAAKAGIDAMAMGEVAANVSSIFDQIQGGAESSEEAFQNLEKASGGVLSGRELEQFSNSMSLAGQSLETTTSVLDIASNVAKATGEDIMVVADQLKDSLVTGAATGFELLGVTLDVNKSLEAQAEALGLTVAEMSTASKATARLSIIQEELGHRFALLGVDTQNLKTDFQSLKKTIESAGEDVARFSLETMRAFQQDRNVKKVAEEIEKVGEAMDEAGHDADEMGHVFKKALSGSLGIPESEVDDAVKMVKKFNLLFHDADEELARLLGRTMADNEKQRIRSAKGGAQKIERIRAAAAAEHLRIEKELDAEKRALEVQFAGFTSATTQATLDTHTAAVAELATVYGLHMGLIDKTQAEHETTLSDVAAESSRIDRKAGDDKKKKDLADKRRAKRKAGKDKEAAEDLKKQEKHNALVARGFAALSEMQIRDLEEREKFKEAFDVKLLRAEVEIKGKEKDFSEKSNREKLVLMREFHLKKLGLTEEFAKEENEREKADQEVKAANAAFNDELKAESIKLAKETRQKAREEEIRELEDFSSRIGQLSGEVNRYNEESAILLGGTAEIFGEVAKNQGNAAKQASGAISASGRTFEALIKDQRRAAATRAIFETASGFASMAGGDVVGATAHFTAAGIFGTIAATGGGSKKGGGGRKATSSLRGGGGGGGGQGFGSGGTGSNVVVNVAGFVTGTTKDLGVAVAGQIEGVNSTGLSTAEV